MNGEKTPMFVAALMLVCLASYGLAQRQRAAQPDSPPTVIATTALNPTPTRTARSQVIVPSVAPAPAPESVTTVEVPAEQPVVPVESQDAASVDASSQPKPLTTPQQPVTNSVPQAQDSGQNAWTVNIAGPDNDESYPAFTEQDAQSLRINGEPLVPVWDYVPSSNPQPDDGSNGIVIDGSGG